MVSIDTSFKSDMNLTIHKVVGSIIPNKFFTHIKDYYLAESITPNILLDLRKARITKLAPADLSDLAKRIKHYYASRDAGKTVLVVSTDLEFGLGRMFEAISETEQLPFEFRSFRNMEQAEAWLIT